MRKTDSFAKNANTWLFFTLMCYDKTTGKYPAKKLGWANNQSNCTYTN